ncbi:MAG: hypothetical protein DWQ07_03655 [Chloroflexi bacterium]|nr:MAG: hypothetical protein DWQ07_03655 [Chloroflexota bacterium]MBL1193402.1 hypothetical protein [Chloroflexota bacterium]NOH10694.1 hypothetical protein [Chloroflexota bacterium]
MSKYLVLLTTTCVLMLTACSSSQVPPLPTPTELVNAPEPPSAPEPTTVDDLDDNGSPQSAVFINESQLLIMESFPVQIAVEIKGDLPAPCHQLVTVVAEPDDQNRIAIDVYSINELIGVDCIQVLEPFEESIPVPMEDQPDGIYTIWINGENIGEFSYPG